MDHKKKCCYVLFISLLYTYVLFMNQWTSKNRKNWRIEIIADNIGESIKSKWFMVHWFMSLGRWVQMFKGSNGSKCSRVKRVQMVQGRWVQMVQKFKCSIVIEIRRFWQRVRSGLRSCRGSQCSRNDGVVVSKCIISVFDTK